jgi:hypothetical protein
MPLFGWRIFSLSSSFLKRSRSSARSIASGEVPRIGTFASSSGTASLSGVWPPNWTITPCKVPLRRSVSTISSTSSAVSGSK